MTDMVQVARRRKLAAAQAVGDVQRITILRGMMTAETPVGEVAPQEAPAAVEVEVPEEVPAVEEIVEPEEAPAGQDEVEVLEEIKPPTDPATGDE
jgi:hypothetical protein